jgi:hypothetical protein
MRYEVRFNNGYWKAFDTAAYRDVDKFGMKIDAEAAARELNAKKPFNKRKGV